jgi:hypothetical protein
VKLDEALEPLFKRARALLVIQRGFRHPDTLRTRDLVTLSCQLPLALGLEVHLFWVRED